MPLKELVSGAKLRIFFWANDQDGLQAKLFNCPNVSETDEKKIVQALHRHASVGFPSNSEKFKKIEGEKLHEIKPTSQFRLLGGFNGKDFIVVLCIKKKQDKISASDLKKATKYWEQYNEERN